MQPENLSIATKESTWCKWSNWSEHVVFKKSYEIILDCRNLHFSECRESDEIAKYMYIAYK